MQRPMKPSLDSLLFGIGRGIQGVGYGVLVDFEKQVRLKVNVLKSRFYAFCAPPICRRSPVSRKDGLQFTNGIGWESHRQGGDILVPVLPVLLGHDELVVGHLKVHSRMIIAVADEARPRIGAKYHWQVGRVSKTPSQKPKQVIQLNGFRFAKGKA
jgi:hypothetical protein